MLNLLRLSVQVIPSYSLTHLFTGFSTTKLCFSGLVRTGIALSLFLTTNLAVAQPSSKADLQPGIPLKASVDVAIDSHQQSVQSQSQVETLNEKTQAAVDQYLANLRQARVTEAYNQQMRKLIASQDKELLDLQTQIDSIDSIERATLPMLNTMVEDLREFVERDTPFLDEERGHRIQRLEQLLDRADVSVAEKYRQILEAYMVEVSYGRTIEAYSGNSDEKADEVGQGLGGRHLVFFRMGRIALYYQTLNGLESGLWLSQERRWQPLTEGKNLVLRKAIQIARQQRVPELLDLPLPSVNPASPSFVSVN